MDKETYEKAREQLDIIHYSSIIHGDINQRNILFSHGKVCFIDFGYSEHGKDGIGSHPVSANPERTNSEHGDLCEVFGQPVSEEYE